MIIKEDCRSGNEPGGAKTLRRIVSIPYLGVGAQVVVFQGICSTKSVCEPLRGKGLLLLLWRARSSITVARE